jgi:hypothetical protein
MRDRIVGKTHLTLKHTIKPAHTLLSRKLKNEERKTLMELIKKRKKQSEAAPINYYKKQSFYKSKNLKDRRKYNQTFRAVEKQHENLDPEKRRFLMYRESLPKGTSLNGLPNVNLDNVSPLYYPDSTKEDEKKRQEGIEAWKNLKKQWAKTDSKRRTRRKPQKTNRKKNT